MSRFGQSVQMMLALMFISVQMRVNMSLPTQTAVVAVLAVNTVVAFAAHILERGKCHSK